LTVLDKLASALDRGDEISNQELAREIATTDDMDAVREDVQELVDNLTHKDKNIRSDCIKVLYEIGAIKPEIIDDYVDEFVALLTHKDNRLVWGAMTALGSIATHKSREVWQHVDTVMQVTKDGSVITQDWGIRVLAQLVAADAAYAARVFPFLIDFLKACRPKDLPRHAESVVIAGTTVERRADLQNTLQARESELIASQLIRVKRVLRQLADA